MEFFAAESELRSLENAINTAQGEASLSLLLTLAWHLRERDTRRALRLCEEIRTRLEQDTRQQAALHYRLLLIEGEAQWLYAQLDRAATLAQQSLQGFSALGDSIGCADAYWLQAMILHVQGNMSARNQIMQTMLACLRQDDPLRSNIVLLTMATDDVFVHGDSVQQRISALFPATAQYHPALQSRIEFFHGICEGQRNHHPQAASHFMHAYQLAMETGQVFYALFAKSNVGYAFIVLNEPQTALEWLQEALGLARECAWPICLGMSLYQTAELLRQMQRSDAARELFNQALQHLSLFPTSRNYAITLGYLGTLELDCANYPQALRHFQNLHQIAQSLQHQELRARADCGCARVYAAQYQVEAAINAAQQVLENPSANLRDKINVLQVLATLHSTHRLPPPAGLTAQDGSVTLHFLQQALQYAQGIQGYSTSVELLDALADEYAALGQHEQAYAYSLQAKQARQQIYSHIAQNRALALQLKHHTDSMRQDNERQRQLAESEAKRAEVLQQTSATLSHLGSIGQEITAHLDANDIFAVLQRHICLLLDVQQLQVYLLSADGQTLQCVFGDAANTASIALADTHSELARAVRECRDIVHQHETPTASGARSHMFAPLRVAERQVLGGMQIQTDRAYAYGQQQQQVFHTLCTYAAVALANAQAHASLASAHASLQESQQQLVLQEKMASLGTLTAGVAHEINNPTNFAHVAAQSLQMDIEKFQHFVTNLAGGREHADAALLQEFDERFSRLHSHVNTVLRGTARITAIVKDLRVFTRLDEAAKKNVRLSECLQSMLNLLRTNWQEQVSFITDFIDDPDYECWPALLNQVFLNLAANACQAIANRAAIERDFHGQLHITMQAKDNLLWISFRDNGIGISSEMQTKIMQTSAADSNEKYGLGLAIARDIVKQHAGQLLLESTPGHGSCFSLGLPLL